LAGEIEAILSGKIAAAKFATPETTNSFRSVIMHRLSCHRDGDIHSGVIASGFWHARLRGDATSQEFPELSDKKYGALKISYPHLYDKTH
jgi:hypothetical protein